VLPVSGFREKFVALRLSTFATQSSSRVQNVAVPRISASYPKLIHYNKLDKGGHFAAWEQPKIFTEELRAGFRSLRKSS
jgi:pimeloyl-ACP methyl ester carboxylesterase